MDIIPVTLWQPAKVEFLAEMFGRPKPCYTLPNRLCGWALEPWCANVASLREQCCKVDTTYPYKLSQWDMFGKTMLRTMKTALAVDTHVGSDSAATWVASTRETLHVPTFTFSK